MKSRSRDGLAAKGLLSIYGITIWVTRLKTLLKFVDLIGRSSGLT